MEDPIRADCSLGRPDRLPSLLPQLERGGAKGEAPLRDVDVYSVKDDGCARPTFDRDEPRQSFYLSGRQIVQDAGLRMPLLSNISSIA
ncbi:hypothetical protein CBM2586_A10294 [Cupriavidus phytorum]|uniref:Uncharacterized protein n=1 Tax=Cupriavidus taiwanensis TaxID=164546 RepID=A0A975WPI0_9BURK|nr:hypothetical protein CBM2586_A10294 [Cupriavidus taiwanensis]